MGYRELCYIFLLVAVASAQTYNVCVNTGAQQCQTVEQGSSPMKCLSVASRIDCAVKMARGEADIGYFSGEETLLLAQMQPNDHRVIATVRDASKMDPYAFESVAIVPAAHTGGLAGLRGGCYCHPGFDQEERWSPRVLKALEISAAQIDQCSSSEVTEKSAEEIEMEHLNSFFSAACRPGTWSPNATVDANLKKQYPNLCSLCGGNCNSYNLNMGTGAPGVNDNNRHIQALECLRLNTNTTAPSVAYVAWQHVREYFTSRNPQDAGNFAALCPDGSLQPLSTLSLANTTAPCAFVRQPWGTIMANNANAAALLTSLQTWWPNGVSPAEGSWQSVLFAVLRGEEGSSARMVFETAPIAVANYTNPIRTINTIESTVSCFPARRWCTLSAAEHTKCGWVRAAAHSLGIQPGVSCQQREDMFACLRDIRDERLDFISSPSNYGYLARQHYKLTPVKLVQNQRVNAARIIALVKEGATQNNITRFENLRDSRACFPEYGGLAYVAFVRAAQERGVLAEKECDYGKAVGEFFSGACAPGALSASHQLTDTSFDATNLCSLCKPAAYVTAANASATTCAYDHSNMYYGNNGTLACLADSTSDVAFVNAQGIDRVFASLNLKAEQFRMLCRNNSLAILPGVFHDESCALAHVVDAEVVTRRNDPLYNSLNVLLDNLDKYFGYNAASKKQLINLELFTAFDGRSDLLFKDTTIGLTEPSAASDHEQARNYIELFRHLQACTGAAPPVGGYASRSVYSVISMILLTVLTRFLY